MKCINLLLNVGALVLLLVGANPVGALVLLKVGAFVLLLVGAKPVGALVLLKVGALVLLLVGAKPVGALVPVIVMVDREANMVKSGVKSIR